jgi:Yip1 domain
MGTAGPAVVPQEQQPSMSFFSRVIGVFLSPGETFDDIARKPDILAPLIVGILGTIAFSEVMLAKIGMERIIRTQLEQSGRLSSMTPDQVDQAVSQGAKFGTILTHLIGIFAVPIVILIIAAVGLGIVNLIFGAKTKFSTAFSITCYANLVGVVGAILGVVMMLFGDPEHFNANAPVPTSVGFFLDQAHTSKPLFALASSIDLFTFWFMVLLGIGFAATTQRKASTTSVFLVFLGLWVAYVLAKVGLASL